MLIKGKGGTVLPDDTTMLPAVSGPVHALRGTAIFKIGLPQITYTGTVLYIGIWYADHTVLIVALIDMML